MTSIADAARRAVDPPPPPMLRFEAVELDGVGAARGAGISFAMPPAGLRVITGVSGSGKRRLTRLAALRAVPARGSVWLFGRDTRTLGRREAALWRRRIGWVAPDDAVLPHFTVFENAALRRRLAGERPAAYGEPVREVLNWIGLGRRAAVSPAALTASERRRLCLAMALAHGPELLVIDEPTEGLDAEAAQSILRLITQAHVAGTALLLVTRDEAVAEAMGALVLRLPEGRAEPTHVAAARP